MKKCEKCEKEFPSEARFCHICGSELREKVTDQSVLDLKDARTVSKNSSSFVVNGICTEKLGTEQERQALLDKANTLLKGERALWLVGAILSVVFYAFLIFGFVSSIVYNVAIEVSYYDEYTCEDEYSYEYEVEPEVSDAEVIFFLMGLAVSVGFYFYVPYAIAGFILAAKSKKCLKTLYIDCTYAYRRCNSALIIVLSVLFNPWVLFFSIPLYRLARKNSRLFLEVAEIQRNYFSYYG